MDRDPQITAVCFWQVASLALHPLCSMGIHRPYAWAHVRWLTAHCAAMKRAKP